MGEANNSSELVELANLIYSSVKGLISYDTAAAIAQAITLSGYCDGVKLRKKVQKELFLGLRNLFIDQSNYAFCATGRDSEITIGEVVEQIDEFAKHCGVHPNVVLQMKENE